MCVDNEGVTDNATGERNQMILPQDVHYEEEIGSGNGGVVRKAIHKSTNMPLAIKIINVYDKGKRHQLYNELKTIKHIECPYLLKCYGAFFEEGSVRLVLEYMDCGSMETMINVLNNLQPHNKILPLIPELVISRVLCQVSISFKFDHFTQSRRS